MTYPHRFGWIRFLTPWVLQLLRIAERVLGYLNRAVKSKGGEVPTDVSDNPTDYTIPF